MTDRTGLYLIAVLGALGGVFSCSYLEEKVIPKVEENNKIIRDMSNIVNSQHNSTDVPVLKSENVIGGPEPDLFYEFKGVRSFLMIDGKPVESYFPNKSSKVELERLPGIR